MENCLLTTIRGVDDDEPSHGEQTGRNVVTGTEMEIGPSDASETREEPSELITSGPGKHNIFVSHSGAQKAFAEQLSEDLRSANHFPFFDQWSDCLPKGERFASNILRACGQCSMAVIILSREYMTSKWPMVELNAFVKAQSSENRRLKLFPVFYKLRPEDLDKISEWEVEWRKFEREGDRRHKIDVEEWTKAVKRLSSFNGLDFAKVGTSELHYKKAIVRDICQQVAPCLKYDTSDVQGCERLCRIIEGMFEAPRNYGEGPEVLGLHGMGGMGKTTMCKALCNHLQQQYGGRVCHVELGGSHRLLELQKRALRTLTRVSADCLQNLTDVGQATHCMKQWMSQEDVFLAVDNVGDSSLEDARAFVKVGFSKRSKVLVTGRSFEVVRDVLAEFVEDEFGHECYCKHIPNIAEGEAQLMFLQEAAPRRSVSSLSEEEKIVVSRCLDKVKFEGKYHPLALRSWAAYFRVVDARKILKWKEHVDDENKLKHCEGSESRMFEILGLGFGTLNEKAKCLFFDVAFGFAFGFLEDQQVDYAGEFLSVRGSNKEWVRWLAGVNNLDYGVVVMELKKLTRMACINDFDDCSYRLTIHDLYVEFAEWYIGKHIDLKYKWVNAKRGDGIDILDKCPGGGVWQDLSRVRLDKLDSHEYISALPPRQGEWANVVVLHIVACKGLTMLSVEGMYGLRDLTIRECLNLVKVSATNESEGKLPHFGALRKLKYLLLVYNESLRCIPNLGQCEELLFVMIVDSPALLMHSIGYELCRKLKNLALVGIGGIYPLKVDLPNLCSFRLDRYPCKLGSQLQLHGMKSLQTLVLRLEHNGDDVVDMGEDLEGLYELTELVVLSMYNHWLNRIPRFDTLTNLRRLELDKVHVRNTENVIFQLDLLQNLEWVWIERTNVHEISGIGTLHKLRQVYIIECVELQKLPDLDGLMGLVCLRVVGCERLGGPSFPNLPHHIKCSSDYKVWDETGFFWEFR